MAEKIILVDDDRNITTSVSMALEAEGFTVSIFNDGEAGLKGILEEKPNLAVLDVKMPRMDGLELLENIRKKDTNLPIIFLTSKDDEIDQVLGLRMGADDYITKPFSQRLLIERIRTLLRRQKLESQSTSNQKTIDLGEMVLDDDRYLCAWKNGAIPLTVTEYLLIKCLASNPGHVKSRDQLIEAAYGETIYVDDRTIDSHIKRVRQKFKKADPQFDRIEAVYGAGYRFTENA